MSSAHALGAQSRAWRWPLVRLADELWNGPRDLCGDCAGRVGFFDEARGLLLAWMVLGHAMELTGVSDSHPLRLLRIGPVTNVFVVLTGLTVGWLYANRDLTRRVTLRLWRRAALIAVVAYISNLLFLSGRMLLEDNAATLPWQDMLLGNAPWTLSGVLLGTSCVVATAPILLWCATRTTPAQMFAGTAAVLAALVVLIDVTGLPERIDWVRWLFVDGGLLGSPPLMLLLFGTLSFSLGQWWVRSEQRHRLWRAVALAGLIGLPLFANLDISGRWVCLLRESSRSCLALFVVAAFAWLPAHCGPRAFLALLGRSSLAVFLGHRVLLHGSVWITDGVDSSGLQCVLCVLAALWLCGLGCGIKEQNPPLQRTLARIGL